MRKQKIITKMSTFLNNKKIRKESPKKSEKENLYKKFCFIPENAQHIGKRQQQQDSFGFSKIENCELIDKAGFIAVIADGMGGFEMGKEASQLAVQVMLKNQKETNHISTISQLLKYKAKKANDIILKMGEEYNLKYNVGTTLVAVLIQNNKLFWISVGDSHIYLYRNKRLYQLNKDHIYANDLNKEVLNGTITQEEADNNPEREYLTSFIGIEELIEIDQNDKPLKLIKNDIILLCSDGLYKTLSDEEITQILSENKKEYANILVKEALKKEKKYQDNITVEIIKYL